MERNTMSLAIPVDNVTGVMIAGQWFNVGRGSFSMDAFEFIEDERDIDTGKTVETYMVLSGGSVEGVCSTGCRWRDPEHIAYACPLTAIQLFRLASSR